MASASLFRFETVCNGNVKGFLSGGRGGLSLRPDEGCVSEG